MTVKKQRFGTLASGEKVYLYTVKNDDMSFCVTSFGCAITAVNLPSKTGSVSNIVLGYSDLAGYIRSPGTYFGALVGRFANRIGGARFTLNGKTYELDKNNGENCLHGGFYGYDKMAWKSKIVEIKEGSGVRFTRVSPAGEQGFPGNLELEATYVLSRHNELIIRCRAVCDEDTPLSLTNHSYFNLNGKGSVLDHELTLNADSYVEADDSLIPTGKLVPVKGTPFDFSKGKKIGQDLAQTGGGYDHNFCINGSKGKLTVCASVYEEKSGRGMVVATNQPGVQFYSGNFLEGREGRLGQTYRIHEGFCLETQQFPDAPNHKNFPDCVLKAGEVFESVTVYGFTW